MVGRILFLLTLCYLASAEIYSIEQTIEGSPNCTTINKSTAAVLSATLPWFGVDRFYMGYIVLGLLKIFLFWTLAVMAVGALVFTIFTIIGIAKAEKKKLELAKKNKDKPKKEKKPKKEEKDEKEPVEGEEEQVKEEKEKEAESEGESDVSDKDSDVDPDSDDENAEAAINRRKKQLIRVLVVIWFAVVIYAVLVLGWFLTDFILILTDVIQPMKCYFISPVVV